jgi:hypothetical protein
MVLHEANVRCYRIQGTAEGRVTLGEHSFDSLAALVTFFSDPGNTGMCTTLRRPISQMLTAVEQAAVQAAKDDAAEAMQLLHLAAEQGHVLAQVVSDVAGPGQPSHHLPPSLPHIAGAHCNPGSVCAVHAAGPAVGRRAGAGHALHPAGGGAGQRRGLGAAEPRPARGRRREAKKVEAKVNAKEEARKERKESTEVGGRG